MKQEYDRIVGADLDGDGLLSRPTAAILVTASRGM
jgi:hypothetical protein